MRSTARIAGHPIHPMLIPLPIAFFIGTLVFDIVARANGSYNWFFVGYVCNVAGVLTGVVAAVPGLVDYFKSIPSETNTKRTATVHMLLNLGVVFLYLISWIIKVGQVTPPAGSLVLQAVGTAMLVVSGWLGWSLVYKHHVGLDLVTDESGTAVSGERRRDKSDLRRTG